MEPPRTYRCEALTLKKSPLGEADLVVTLFTKDRGKLRAVAKGARRTSSRLMGHLEPLTQVRLSMVQGRNLDYVTQAQVIESFANLKQDLGAITKGIYLAELVDGFGSEASSNQPLYQMAVEVLESIGQAPESEWPLRYFEVHLLRLSGLMPELYRCVECQVSLSPGNHRFSPTLGGTLCPICQPLGVQVRPLSLRLLKVLRLLHRSPLPSVMGLKADPTLAYELKSVLGGTVRYWLDKEIRSNSFLEQLHRESKTGVYT
jgi:DNA repair protein RecO (recombination protein O)